MRKERRIFEERIREYKEMAQEAIDTVNETADLFNSYGYPFCVYDKETLMRKCGDNYITKAIESILTKAISGGLNDNKVIRIEHKCSLMKKILSEPAERTKEALKGYGRIIHYDNNKLCFIFDRDKLESYAMRYAEDME